MRYRIIRVLKHGSRNNIQKIIMKNTEYLLEFALKKCDFKNLNKRYMCRSNRPKQSDIDFSIEINGQT